MAGFCREEMVLCKIKLYYIKYRDFVCTFKGVAARTNQQTDKIDVGMFLLRNQHLVADSNHRWPANKKSFIIVLSSKQNAYMSNKVLE